MCYWTSLQGLLAENGDLTSFSVLLFSFIFWQCFNWDCCDDSSTNECRCPLCTERRWRFGLPLHVFWHRHVFTVPYLIIIGFERVSCIVYIALGCSVLNTCVSTCFVPGRGSWRSQNPSCPSHECPVFLFLFIVSLVVLKTLRFLNWHVSLVLMNIQTLPHPAGHTPVMLDIYSVIAPDRDPVWLEFSRFPRTETFNQDASATPDSGGAGAISCSHTRPRLRDTSCTTAPPSCVTSFRPPVCAVSLSSTTQSRTLKGCGERALDAWQSRGMEEGSEGRWYAFGCFLLSACDYPGYP